MLLMLAALAGCGTSTQKAATSTEKVAPAAAKTEAGVGQPVTSGPLTLTAVSSTVSQGDDFSTPADGSQFIVVDLEVANNGSSSYAFSTMLMLSVSTPEGRKYTQAAYFPEPKFPDGTIAAGEKARGNVAFEVPTTVSAMSLAFDPVTGEGVKIKLQ